MFASEAAKRIAAALRDNGPITFRDFMWRALYDPGYGYYGGQRSPWSGVGDYVTGPQVHAAFGGAVARFVSGAYQALGAPADFDLVEAGGGDGTLIADLCAALQRDAPEAYARLRIWCVEQSAALRALQQSRLGAEAGRTTWLESLAGLPASGVRGVIFSNELLDALPVHRIVQRDGKIHELWVDVERDGFVARPGPLSTPRLAEHLELNGIVLRDGQVADVCLAVADWLASAARALAAGYLLTIDYGAETEALYGPDRMRGSLVCQHRYQLNDDPFLRVGEQDITAHVDFGNLRRRAAACGFASGGECSLVVFLSGFGAAEGAGMPGPGSDREEIRRYLGLRHLLLSEIGDAHRVVLHRKDAPALLFGRQRLG